MDRGAEFNNTGVQQWLKQKGGIPHYSTARRPTACGMIERWNRSILSIIRAAKYEFPDHSIGECVEQAIQHYWNRPHSSLGGNSPAECLYGTIPEIIWFRNFAQGTRLIIIGRSSLDGHE
jgi:transposase InsO family protein